ncbi:RNA 3'-terminal phosphate cyclase (ATP) [Pseudomonas duriflava]|uniref:RNA 3'-terminal phosphate cyclase n=1 Tax=Pseudomonas duriflava TaxID=459528 RepID=A0A562QE91_9PSED|nr:RNA 3'-terminal phosphate cyclase [Pseudomonas duriflava]TWI55054.1 RNA 3'-terminal phosphate cyclase (ATP) [Pseudomonas duriflava]
MEELDIDGTIGGGQILRSALSLSMITGRSFRIDNIRGKRSRPGLLRQHLTAVQAAAQVCGATLEGAELGSLSLRFQPGPIRGGHYEFAISTAGSCTLVFQTVLPALLRAPEPSHLLLTGGTHNPAAPPADFLQKAWLPLLQRMGAQVELTLIRHGFAPAGGGAIEAHIVPSALQPLYLEQRGSITYQQAQALVAGLPASVGQRELRRIAERLGWPRSALHNIVLAQARGPGNVVLIEQGYEAVSEIFVAFGQPRVRAEPVADQAIAEAQAFERSAAAVGEHLADQLLLPLVLAGGGRFTCMHASDHLRSNAEIIARFCPVQIRIEPLHDNCYAVTVTT